MQYLIKKRGPAEIKEISNYFKINRSNISHSVKGLVKEKAVLVKQVKVGCFIKYIISINPKY